MRKKAWVNPGEAAILTPKKNIHCTKVMLYIWWNIGVIYYNMLKFNETITVAHYCQQKMRLKRVLDDKRPEWNNRHDKVILQHDNARKILIHPPYSYTGTYT